jgi:putative tricarboxylic transport membrane protein
MSAGDTGAWTPQRVLEIVAGTPPGGGLDRTARALVRAIEANKLSPVPVGVVNVAGDGGRKSWVHIDGHAGDPHMVGITSPNLVSDFLMGTTTSDPARFTPIAILYTEYIAFVARPGAGPASGADLLARLERDPTGLTVALSTSLGNPNHIALAKVIRRAGADPKAPTLRVFDSALDAVADVVAGHAELGAITAASAVPELEAGRLTSIAISAPARIGGPYAATPTWGEQGVDCVVGSWRGVSGPAGLPAAATAFWTELLAAATRTSEWQADLARHFWTDVGLYGARLADHLQRERAETRTLLGELGLTAR